MTFATNFARALSAGGACRRGAGRRRGEFAPTWRRLKAHIGAVHTMTANFIQTDARGRSAAGTLQLKRPGKVRFQYGSGDLLLVADGKTPDFHRLSGRAEDRAGRSASTRSASLLRFARPQRQRRDPASNDPRVVVARAREPAQYGS